MARIPVHEVRKLMLPLDTALDAVLELDSEQGGPLAFGVVVSAQIETDPVPGLMVVVQRRGTESTDSRKFELSMLAAAFIRYCWKCRIPLPRYGAKKIEIGPDGFIFTIEGTVEVVRRHGGLPQRGALRSPAAAAAPAKAAESVEPEPVEPESAEPVEPVESVPVNIGPEEAPVERVASAS